MDKFCLKNTEVEFGAKLSLGFIEISNSNLH